MKSFLLIFIDQFKTISEYNNGNENPAYIFMYILAIIGFFSLVLVLDRFIILWKSRINYKGFVNPLMKDLERGDLRSARKRIRIAQEEESLLAEIISRGLGEENLNRGENLKDAIHEAKLEIFPQLRRRTNFIVLLQNISTLIGLSGTIFGLIIAFDAVGGHNVADASKVLASGISAAMGTTIAGLFVAIPALTCGSIINYKVNDLIKNIDFYSFKISKLININ